MPKGKLNKKQHDLMVLLAEDVPWWSAIEWSDYKRTSFNGQLYYLMKLHDVAPQGDFDANVAALVTEAKLRGYQNMIYMLMYDDMQMEIDELGAPLPRYVDPLPRLVEA